MESNVSATRLRCREPENTICVVGRRGQPADLSAVPGEGEADVVALLAGGVVMTGWAGPSAQAATVSRHPRLSAWTAAR